MFHSDQFDDEIENIHQQLEELISTDDAPSYDTVLEKFGIKPTVVANPVKPVHVFGSSTPVKPVNVFGSSTPVKPVNMFGSSNVFGHVPKVDDATVLVAKKKITKV